jgi:lipid-A-disaccharide synthase
MPRPIYIIAGEASGDFLGAQLIKALKKHAPQIEVAGIGGSLMEQEGVKSLFPMHELSLMGLVEILPHAFHLMRRINQTVQDIIEKQPAVVVTIDSPGFCLRVAKKLKKQTKIPIVHYVAPSVWAWREGRARKLAKKVDHLLTLFPFEPPYFEKYGLKTTFVGHPLIEQEIKSDPTFRERHHIPAEATLLSLLPGSRKGEIDRLLPIFLEAAQLLTKDFPSLQIVIPTLPHLFNVLVKYMEKSYLPITVVETPGEKYAAFFASDAALAASGTVSLELAICNLPMVIAYKLSPVTHFIVKRLVKIKNACLVNILLGKSIVPEKLQDDCDPLQLAFELNILLQNQGGQAKQYFKKAVSLLSSDNYQSPSEKAAQTVLTYCS